MMVFLHCRVVTNLLGFQRNIYFHSYGFQDNRTSIFALILTTFQSFIENNWKPKFFEYNVIHSFNSEKKMPKLQQFSKLSNNIFPQESCDCVEIYTFMLL